MLNINKGKTTVIDFNKTQLNLSDYSSKTTKYPNYKKLVYSFYQNVYSNPKTKEPKLCSVIKMNMDFNVRTNLNN